MSGSLAMNDALAFSTSMHKTMRTRVNAVGSARAYVRSDCGI